MEQKLIYETRDDALSTYLKVAVEPTNVHGAAIEVMHKEFLAENGFHNERIILTVTEALLLIEHLSQAVRKALEEGDGNFAPAEAT